MTARARLRHRLPLFHAGQNCGQKVGRAHVRPTYSETALSAISSESARPAWEAIEMIPSPNAVRKSYAAPTHKSTDHISVDLKIRS
jgi:hypothetical protein